MARRYAIAPPVPKQRRIWARRPRWSVRWAAPTSVFPILDSALPLEFPRVRTPQKLPDANSYNVIADLKGSEHPEQIVVISGHLDSWDLGTGAIDDAAGVV